MPSKTEKLRRNHERARAALELAAAGCGGYPGSWTEPLAGEFMSRLLEALKHGAPGVSCF